MIEPRTWSDDELTVVRAASSVPRPGEGAWLNAGTFTAYWQAVARAVLDALDDAGWAPLHRVTCYEVHGEGCHAPENVTLIYAGEHG